MLPRPGVTTKRLGGTGSDQNKVRAYLDRLKPPVTEGGVTVGD